jgi:hypothetical protein
MPLTGFARALIRDLQEAHELLRDANGEETQMVKKRDMLQDAN